MKKNFVIYCAFFCFIFLASCKVSANLGEPKYLEYTDAYKRPCRVPVIASFDELKNPSPGESIQFAYVVPVLPPSYEFILEASTVASCQYRKGPSGPVAAIFFMPDLTDPQGKVPIVIGLCDSFGFRKDDRDFALWLKSMGIASLWIDSEVSRGNTKVMNNQMGASLIGNVAEMYTAFKLAKTHPNIDCENVFAYGSSRGGVVAELARRTDLHMHFGQQCSFKAFFIVSGLPIIQPNDCGLQNSALVPQPTYYYHGCEDNWNSTQAQRNWFLRQSSHRNNVSWHEYPGGHCFERSVKAQNMSKVQTFNERIVVMHAQLLDFATFNTDLEAAMHEQNAVADNETGQTMAPAALSDEIKAPEEVDDSEILHTPVTAGSTEEDEGQSSAVSGAPIDPTIKLLSKIPGYTIIGTNPYPGDNNAIVRNWIHFAADFSRLARGADVKPSGNGQQQFLRDITQHILYEVNR